MSTGISPAIIRLASRLPRTSRLLLRLLSRFIRQPHWVLCRIASALHYYPVVQTRLGNGMAIRVFWGQIVGTGILVNGFHEPHTTRVVEQLLKPGMTFFDVGANIGQYTLLAAGLVGPQGSVHGFEPDGRTFSVLEANLAINRVGNATVTRCAVGAESVESGPVPRVCLDDYIRQRQIERVDLIKIDIDGGELDVLRGARQLLSSAHPPQLVVEFAESNQAPLGHTCAEMADFLRGFGNELFCIDQQGLIPYAPWGPERAYFNVLARVS